MPNTKEKPLFVSNSTMEFRPTVANLSNGGADLVVSQRLIVSLAAVLFQVRREDLRLVETNGNMGRPYYVLNLIISGQLLLIHQKCLMITEFRAVSLSHNMSHGLFYDRNISKLDRLIVMMTAHCKLHKLDRPDYA